MSELAPTLFDDTDITVHCFTCPHTVRAFDPHTAHELMEDHYRAHHSLLIASLVL